MGFEKNKLEICVSDKGPVTKYGRGEGGGHSLGSCRL